MLRMASEESGKKIAYKYKNADEEIVEVTFSDFYSDVLALGAAISKLGYGCAHIACTGDNSYKWIVTYLTALCSGGVFVPIDKDLPPKDMAHLITDSESSIVFCDAKRRDLILSNLSDMPNLKTIVCFDSEEDGNGVLSFDVLTASGKKMCKTEYLSLSSDENELKMLVYTSGTTGNSKGVMLSEHNLISGVYYGLQISQIPDTGLSVLPYHHTYEAVCGILVAIHYRRTLCINESYRAIAKNLKLYKPSYIYIVPTFADFFYSNINKEIDRTGKRESFERALKISRKLLKHGIDVRRILFKKILNGLGGRLIKIVCGGAAVRPSVAKFFYDIGINFHIGYGITECSPLVSVNSDADLKFNSVGHRLSCIDWKIENTNDEGVGEICVKGDVVMLGYYNRPDLTAEVLQDGWFHTGDYGYITENDELVITGRKKNIIVLSNGKNVYPEEIETYILTKVPYINEVVVRGSTDSDGYVVGLAAEIYSESGCDKKQALADMRAAVSELQSYKTISEVIIREEPFPKTSTNKIKR